MSGKSTIDDITADAIGRLDERLVTHLFIAGDPYLQSDAVFGVKQSLIVTPVKNHGVKYARYDFVLPSTNR